MFLKQISGLRHYLKIKLTLWYTGVLTLTLLVALFFLYASVEDYFIKTKDTAIRNEYREFQIIFQEGGVPAVQHEAGVGQVRAAVAARAAGGAREQLEAAALVVGDGAQVAERQPSFSLKKCLVQGTPISTLSGWILSSSK